MMCVEIRRTCGQLNLVEKPEFISECLFLTCAREESLAREAYSRDGIAENDDVTKLG
jgi:hypothetical protein